MLQKFKGYRTLGFNAVASVAPVIDVLQGLVNSTDVASMIPDQYMPLYALIVAIGNALLRFKTDTAVGQK